MKRPKTPLKLELPLICFLGFFWMAIWQDFTLGTFLIGAIYATIIVRVFYLPPLRGSGRLNLWWGLVFTLRFLVKMIAASFQVSWIAVAVGPKVKNSIISVQLRSHDDLIVTLTGHALALVPGSLVLDVDRTTATLYLHALDVDSDEDAERIRQDALRTEALIIMTCGNRSDVAVVKAEKRLGRMSGFSKTERDAPFIHRGGGPSEADRDAERAAGRTPERTDIAASADSPERTTIEEVEH
ncbi:Na+/H+ antiporter subunit E [Nesterenkonia sandarakina]|uniref:Multisubunit sodium/proton antiporter MrpE subunit n=1 Tax=Nesterenkonia sandarakina TaxID=272918 RepID=A0A2T0YQD6_9MICC|nr:Na+/H+ antiporter subunit E [Nesterenkonia sandarakina]PRZ17621.1 multisubunit sodium/proton antiporter MrpE subunit [Nesterenkonia sandarakina]